ncbi:MAG: SAM-dependent methyltransferase [Candidatus Thorarchaeota archaeon]
MTDNHKKDPHYKLAKREKYRARSAFKLLDIQKRFNIFKRAFYILDLGCAPGSWLQVSKNFAETNLTKYNDRYYHRDHYLILGVDVKKVSQIENVHVIKEDFMKQEVNTLLETYFKTKIDLILSDASINKTGNKFSDHLRQNNLCLRVLELTDIFLKFKGSLVMKTFQGSDFDKVFHKAKSAFKMLKAFKPQSSKKKSNEIYLIGLQKR